MRSVSSFVIACVVAWSATAVAQSSKAAATIQFDKGRALLKQGKYEEACTAFEASQKLDPANGTLFNIAECSEQLGKLSTAWLAYRELGQSDTDAGRKLEAGRRAKRLLPRLPKLLVRIDDAPSGLVLKINDNDSTALIGIESPVDLGEYTIRATAPGYEPFETTASVKAEGKTVKVELELEEKKSVANPKPKKKKPKPVEPSVEVSHRMRNGVLVGIAGGVVLVAGGVFGLDARSAWSDAEALCPNKACASPADKQMGDALVDSARSDATKSTVLVLGGAAIVGVGIYLVATKKPRSVRSTSAMIAPTRGGGAIVLGGRF